MYIELQQCHRIYNTHLCVANTHIKTIFRYICISKSIRVYTYSCCICEHHLAAFLSAEEYLLSDAADLLHM